MISTESENQRKILTPKNNVKVKVQPPPTVSTVHKGRHKIHWNMGWLLGFCMQPKKSRSSFYIVRKVLAPFIFFGEKKILAPSHFLSKKSLPHFQFSFEKSLFSTIFYCFSSFSILYVLLTP